MNTENKVKNILIMGASKEERARLIGEFTIFVKEDVITALNEGGRTSSDIYRNLVNLDKRRD